MTATQAPTPGPLSGDDDLLPCPFCEGDVIVTDSQECQDAETYYWHRCAGCGVESEGAHGASAARDQWNMRPQPFRLAPTAPVEASGSERDRIARLAWTFRGNDRLGGPFYDGAKPTDSPAMRDAFAFADAVIDALRPQPSGETRKLLERAAAIADDVERGKRPKLEAVDMIRELRNALLSARPLALGGQHSGGDYIRPNPKGDGWIRSQTTPARAEAQDEGAAGELIKELRLAACGLFNLKNESGDYGYFDSIADRVAALYAHPSPPPAADGLRIAVEGLERIKAYRVCKESANIWTGATACRAIADETLTALKGCE